MSSGKVVQVIGPVVDVEFPLDDKLPDINTALHIKKKMMAVSLLLKLPLN